MFSLILQAVAALYVFIQSLPGNKLRAPTLLIFIAGVIKYAERIWALYCASLDRFRESMLQDPNPGPDYAHLMKNYASMRKANLPTKIIMVEEPEKEVKELKEGKLTDVEVVHYAYHFFETFQGLVVDLVFSIHARKESRDFFLAREPADALSVIEAELNFMYGVFYTKMKVMHTVAGYIFRFIAFGSVLAALGLFHFKAKKAEFDATNVKISYILLLGALALEVGALLVLIFSDWTLASLPVPHVLKSVVTAIFRCFLALKKPRWYSCKSKILKQNGGEKNGTVVVLGTPSLFRRWSGSVSAHNFIRYCLKSSQTTMHEFPSWWKIIFGKIFLDIGVTKYLSDMKKVLKSNCLVSRVTQAFCFIPKAIAKYLSKKKNSVAEDLSEKKKEPNSFISGVTWAFCDIPKTIARKTGLQNFLDEMRYVSQEPLTEELWNFIFMELKEKSDQADSPEIARKISSSRGEWVLMSYLADNNLSEFVSEEVEYDERLLLWHIATDICYHIDCKKNWENQDNLDKKNQKIISKLLSDYMLYLLVMRPDFMSTVVGIGKIRFQDTEAEAERLFNGAGLRPNNDKEACEEIIGVNTDVKPVSLKGDRSKSVLFDACRLAKELNKVNGKWLIMSKVWVELLSYAATHCRASAHAEQISKGGELITFVWLLMAHLGLGHYFQTTKVAKLIPGK